MKWLWDVFLLFGEWFLLMLIPLAIGLFIGWVLWYRRCQEAEDELEACQRETESIALSRSEDIEAFRLKLKRRDEESAELLKAQDKELDALRSKQEKILSEHKEKISSINDLLANARNSIEDLEAELAETKAAKTIAVAAETPESKADEEDDHHVIFEQQLAKATEGMVLDYEDDLKLISGVGPKMEKTLKDFGVQTFLQLSAFDEKGIAALNEKIDTFPGRVERDDWVGQAKKLHEDLHINKQ